MKLSLMIYSQLTAVDEIQEERERVKNVWSLMGEKGWHIKNKVAGLCVCLWGKHLQPESDCQEPHEGLSAAAPGRTLAASAAPVCFFLPCLNEAAASFCPRQHLLTSTSILLCYRASTLIKDTD